MKKLLFLVFIVSISIALVGCISSNNQTPVDQSPNQDADEKIPTEQDAPRQDSNGQVPEGQEPKEHNGTEQPTDSNGITIDLLKQQLFIGMTQQEVLRLFGEQYTSVKSAMDNTDLWRYDVDTVEGYVSPEDEYDFGDIDGLLNHELTMQIFVEWDNNDLVSGYSAIYFNEADGRVYSYHMFEDGFEKEQAITN